MKQTKKFRGLKRKIRNRNGGHFFWLNGQEGINLFSIHY